MYPGTKNGTGRRNFLVKSEPVLMAGQGGDFMTFQRGGMETDVCRRRCRFAEIGLDSAKNACAGSAQRRRIQGLKDGILTDKNDQKSKKMWIFYLK